MSTWPPPPDLVCLIELFATSDVEGLIADESPPGEQDSEAQHFYEATRGPSPESFGARQTLPLLEELWVRQFTLDAAQLARRRPDPMEFGNQIDRFFGPEAQPQGPGSVPNRISFA